MKGEKYITFIKVSNITKSDSGKQNQVDYYIFKICMPKKPSFTLHSIKSDVAFRGQLENIRTDYSE